MDWLGVLRWASALVFAYLVGSVPVGYVVARRFAGIDIRHFGSGNVGAANVTRTLGKRAGLLVLLGDVAKGVLAGWIGSRLGGAEAAALTGLAAVLGHAWPVFLRFSGGKSVATGFGALLIIAPWAAGALVLIWSAVALSTGYSSLASLVSAATVPLWLWLALHSQIVLATGLVMTLIIVLRHRANVRRLLTGSERRVY